MSVAAHTTVNAPEAPLGRDVSSRLLGDIAVPSDHIFTFPDGLHGFADHNEYALIPAARAGYWWLQATDVADLAFLLADPFECAPGYEVDLSEGDRQFLGLQSAEDVVVLTVVTLPARQGEMATTNLRGPLVFNARTLRARQIVSANDAHSLHAMIDLASNTARDVAADAV